MIFETSKGTRFTFGNPDSLDNDKHTTIETERVMRYLKGAGAIALTVASGERHRQHPVSRAIRGFVAGAGAVRTATTVVDLAGDVFNGNIQAVRAAHEAIVSAGEDLRVARDLLLGASDTDTLPPEA